MHKRVDALDKQIQDAASESVFWPVVQVLMALRGVSLHGGDHDRGGIGDLQRFASAPQLTAYLGVVPSEHSSVETKSRGGNHSIDNSLVHGACSSYLEVTAKHNGFLMPDQFVSMPRLTKDRTDFWRILDATRASRQKG